MKGPEATGDLIAARVATNKERRGGRSIIFFQLVFPRGLFITTGG